ncbi:unnamed protein product [Cylicocyclus nassatus]|uniref:Uncharacterized protein n=1 Tax=Cylicocyclus nassatus TaxID=53992 RepID=A0AA36GLN8_CYLNA|nr:unnamed protein product [Cylicocyclus nassatus]
MDKLLEDLSTDIIRYPTSKGAAFSWPAPAGISGGILAIRARVTYDFWKFFMMEGRKNLYEYNSKNGTDIKISRERTLPLEDQDRLGLFIRRSIRDAYTRANKKCVEISLRKSMIKIGDNNPLKPAIAAIVLNLDLTAWSGLPIEELLTEKEKNSVKAGEIERGSMKLPEIDLPVSNQDEHLALDLNKENEEDTANSHNDEEAQSSTMLKKRSLEMEDEPPAKKAVQ